MPGIPGVPCGVFSRIDDVRRGREMAGSIWARERERRGDSRPLSHLAGSSKLFRASEQRQSMNI
eukprot:2725055-Prymnesium_polylepis.3